MSALKRAKSQGRTIIAVTQRRSMLQIADENKLPVVVLAQSGGGNLSMLGDFFGYSGAGFARQARLSAAGIPQVTVVHGSATAGGATPFR